MVLSIVSEHGIRFAQGVQGQSFMSRVDDANRLIEACFSNNVRMALLYGENLPRKFFDLSSGEAGKVLQKLRNYGVRLAVVCPGGSVQFSSRFSEMVAEERLRPHFGVFDTRDAARDWLARLGAQ